MSNDTETLSLSDFLLARIAEDEAVAQRVRDQFFAESPDAAADHGLHESDSRGYPSLRIGESRVLDECAVKRRIVELANWEGDKDSIRDRIFGPSADLAFQKGIGVAIGLLALPYADHPDYREDWRP